MTETSHREGLLGATQAILIGDPQTRAYSELDPSREQKPLAVMIGSGREIFRFLVTI